MSIRLVAAAWLACVVGTTSAQAQNADALQLLKLSLACSAKGTTGQAQGYNLSSKESYEYIGDATTFSVKATHKSVGDRSGKAVSFQDYTVITAPVNALMAAASKGTTAGIACKTKDQCIIFESHLTRGSVHNVLVRDADESASFHFCSPASADDFEAAVGELTK